MNMFRGLREVLRPKDTEPFRETPHADPRWLDLADGKYKCACCGLDAREFLSLSYIAPAPFPHDIDQIDLAPLANDIFDTVDGDILTDDFCRVDTHHFVRTVIVFPLDGVEGCMMIGVWVSLETEDFARYHATMDRGQQSQLDLMFGWLANPVGEYDRPVAVLLHPQDSFQRPWLQIAHEEHPLAIAQIDGLTFDQMMNFIQAHGHSFTN